MRRWTGPVVVCLTAIAACVTTAKLAETEQMTVTIMSPTGSAYDFGTVPLGSMAMTGTSYFTLSVLQATDKDTITDISPYQCSGDFGVDLSLPLPYQLSCNSGPSGGTGSGSSFCTTYTLGAHFSPSFSGMQSCNVRITYMQSSGLATFTTISLTGTGGASQYAWDVTPTSIDFSDVPTSGSATRTITITNKGTTGLGVSSMLGDQTDYSIGPSTSVQIGPGSNQIYSVVCHPTAGSHPSMVSFNSQAGSASVSLACNGVTTSMDVTPNPVDFGSQLIGATLPAVNVSIKNSGSVPVTLTNFGFDAGTSSDVSYPQPPGTIAIGSGSSFSVPVAYSAASAHDPATPLGTMKFDWTSAAGAGTSHVSITGGAQLGMIGTNPAGIDFGPVCLSQGTVAKTLNIYTSAPGPVNVTALSAPQNAAFHVMPALSLPHVIPGHTNPGLDLTTSVQPSAPGELTDSFAIQTNIPGTGSATTISLHAVVLPSGIAPTPSDLMFGAVRVGMTSSGKEVVLSNCGSGDLMVTGSHLEGTDSGEFALVSPDVAKTLHAGDSESFLLIMNPHTVGTKSATFVVEHSAGTTPVMLDGNAFSGSDTGGKDRETYYGCAATRGTSAWPIAFALGLLARRRRRR